MKWQHARLHHSRAAPHMTSSCKQKGVCIHSVCVQLVQDTDSRSRLQQHVLRRANQGLHSLLLFITTVFILRWSIKQIVLLIGPLRSSLQSPRDFLLQRRNIFLQQLLGLGQLEIIAINLRETLHGRDAFPSFS